VDAAHYRHHHYQDRLIPHPSPVHTKLHVSATQYTIPREEESRRIPQTSRAENSCPEAVHHDCKLVLFTLCLEFTNNNNNNKENIINKKQHAN
jgi:hypothetical protein